MYFEGFFSSFLVFLHSLRLLSRNLITKLKLTFFLNFQLGPNVSIGSGVQIGPGVRMRESIVLDNAIIKDHTLVLHSISEYTLSSYSIIITISNFIYFSFFFYKQLVVVQQSDAGHELKALQVIQIQINHLLKWRIHLYSIMMES